MIKKKQFSEFRLNIKSEKIEFEIFEPNSYYYKQIYITFNKSSSF
jgi:hypothetical protein